MRYARGLIDHQFREYVREDGMIVYRGEELAQSARMLTILALYYRTPQRRRAIEDETKGVKLEDTASSKPL